MEHAKLAVFVALGAIALAFAVYWIEQLAVVALCIARVQNAVAGVNTPVLLVANDTVPVGVDAVGTSVSVTVAVQVEVPFRNTAFGTQVTDVLVVRLFT